VGFRDESGGSKLANHKSAIKKARMSLRRNVINTRTLNEVRTLERKLRKAVTDKNKDQSSLALVEFSSKVTKAAQKGRLKRETAARKVSRLAKLVAAL
jgi:small subunit ribosomal protein S20